MYFFKFNLDSQWVTTSTSRLKGTVHPQIIFLKYVMLRTVTKNSTIIITKVTWYHRYRETIQITGTAVMAAPDARIESSNITWPRSTLSSDRHQLVLLVLLRRLWFFQNNQIHLQHAFCSGMIVYMLLCGLCRLLVKLMGSGHVRIQELPVFV